MKLAVVIPTYRRPKYLARCWDRIAVQTRAPDAVVVVTRDSDVSSRAVAARLGRRGIPLIHGTVSRPGHIPPLDEARRLLPDDVALVCIVDDDLMLHDDALARAVRHFADPAVAAVAGRVLEYDAGRPRPARCGPGGGGVGFSGTVYSGHADRPSSDSPRPTVWASGGIVVYRREAFDALVIRDRLNVDSAVGYEIDWGLQLARLGGRVMFDPAFCGDHLNAPRHGASERSESRTSRVNVFARNHNYTYVMLHHLRGLRRFLYLARTFAIGNTYDWAVGAAVYATIAHRDLRWVPLLAPAYRGKLAGIASYRADARR